MEHVPIFWFILTGIAGFALVRGGGPERVVAIIFVLGAVTSSVATRPMPERFGGIEIGVFGVDLMMFASLTYVAMWSRRYWPLWLVALQALELSSHFAHVLPHMLRLACGLAISFWSYPMLLILLMGTIRHRMRLALGLNERGWVHRC